MIIILPRDEIFGVSDEFRIRSRAQFVEIHALAFSSIATRNGQIRLRARFRPQVSGNTKPSSVSNSHDLGQPLSGCTGARHRYERARNVQDRAVEARENADRQDAPETADGVH